MPGMKSWIVCEATGRWTAALRLALAKRRPPAHRQNWHTVPSRVREVRSIPELVSTLGQYGDALALVEVHRQNLAEVLALLAGFGNREMRPVALLGDSLQQAASHQVNHAGDQELAIDALYEAGVLDVIESPRQIGGLLELVDRGAAAAPRTELSANLATLAEFARAALPWQDA